MKKNDLSPEAFRFEGKMSLKQALPLGMQHVLAMFVGNLTPLLIITGACGLAGGEFADLRVTLLQNAMLVAGIVTLVQLYSIGPIGGKVPIIMGTSSGFIGVFSSVAASMGGGVLAYGAIMGASLIGGLFETVLGFFLKPLRKLLPSVVTGTVVLSIGLSLISVGVNSFGGGNTAQDFGSVENLLLAIFVLVVILICKHSGSTFLNSSSILVGIICGYIAAFLMGLILPTTALNAEGVAYTKAWVLNWNKVAEAKWFALPELMPVKPVFDMRQRPGLIQPHQSQQTAAQVFQPLGLVVNVARCLPLGLGVIGPGTHQVGIAEHRGHRGLDFMRKRRNKVLLALRCF